MDTFDPTAAAKPQRPSVHYHQARGILTRTNGFTDAYDFTLNPYAGCAFACNYCYAAFFAATRDLQETWGQWVHVKENALALLRKHKPLLDKSIYLSSVTDPYQPIEARLELTRALLEELADRHRVRLVVQTRAPLVTRDSDLFRRIVRGGGAVRVNVTVTTDDETVRRAFEPQCPSIQQRLNAAAALVESGVDTCVTLTPLLPVRDAAAFAVRLRATGVQKFVIQNFHGTRSRFVAGTGDHARRVLAAMQWDERHYQQVRAALAEALPNLREGKDGFVPEW